MPSSLRLADFRIARLTGLHLLFSLTNPDILSEVLTFDPEILDSKLLPNFLWLLPLCPVGSWLTISKYF